jgi:O-acetyl-ADP-ribose deacetylase (regulator of RNase III)
MFRREVLDRIRVVRGDITREKVDAIVNAANSGLRGGGGVDGAIHRAAGPELLRECATLGGCPTGDARVTGGYRLPAKWVIHTVGPVWSGGNRGEAEKLASAYRRSLEEAVRIGAATVAFPAVSTGVYGYPPREAARIAVAEVAAFLEGNGGIREVRLVCFSGDSEALHREALEALRGEGERVEEALPGG